MAIVLEDTGSGYNLSTINNNFKKIEDELNDKVLRREVNKGEANEMRTHLDMNNQRTVNAKDAVDQQDLVTFKQLQDASVEDVSGLLTLEVVARYLNIENAQVIFSNNTLQVLDSILNIYDGDNQIAYVKPSGVGGGETIVGTLDNVLTTSGGTYTMERVTHYPEDKVNASAFGLLEDTDISTGLQAVLDNMPSTGELTLNPGSYIINSDVVIYDKGDDDNANSTFKIDFTGCVFSGSGNFIYDSCRNIETTGLHIPDKNIILRAIRFSDFKHCKAREVVFCDQAGTDFNFCFWISFHDCMFQVLRRGNSIYAANVINFYNVSLRGDATQGFSSSEDYAIILEASSSAGNAQSWAFYGGDISYHSIAILNDLQTADAEITFNGVYFDTLIPETPSRSGVRISTVKCHGANIEGYDQTYSDSTVSEVDIWREDRWLKLSPHSGYNLILGGDFTKRLETFQDIMIQSGGGSNITTASGGPHGMLMNINQSTTSTVFFKVQPSSVGGVATGTVLLKSKAGSGSQEVRIGFSFGAASPRFRTVNITEEWELYTLTDSTRALAGVTPVLSLSQPSLLPYNLDIGFLSVSVGAGGGLDGACNYPKRIEHDFRLEPSPTSIPSLGTYVEDIAISDTIRGDYVLVSTNSTNFGNLMISAVVRVDGTVRLTVFNPTASPVVPGFATAYIEIRKRW